MSDLDVLFHLQVGVVSLATLDNDLFAGLSWDSTFSNIEPIPS